jgi:hypothetical protein
MKVAPIVKAKRPIPSSHVRRPRTRAYARQVAELAARPKVGWRELKNQWLAQQPKSVLRKMEQDELELKRSLERTRSNNERSARLEARSRHNESDPEPESETETLDPYRIDRERWYWDSPPTDRRNPFYYNSEDKYMRKVGTIPWYHPPQIYYCMDCMGNVVLGADPRWEPPPWSNYAYRKKEVLDANDKKITVVDVEGTPANELEFILWRRATINSYLKAEWIQPEST